MSLVLRSPIRSSLQVLLSLLSSLFDVFLKLLGLRKNGPPITLEDPNTKYPLRLIDKEVSLEQHTAVTGLMSQAPDLTSHHSGRAADSINMS